MINFTKEEIKEIENSVSAILNNVNEFQQTQ